MLFCLWYCHLIKQAHFENTAALCHSSNSLHKIHLALQQGNRDDNNRFVFAKKTSVLCPYSVDRFCFTQHTSSSSRKIQTNAVSQRSSFSDPLFLFRFFVGHTNLDSTRIESNRIESNRIESNRIISAFLFRSAMARFSFSPGSVVAIALALLALSSMTTTTTTTTEALKHNYYTRRDERSLIGPLGFPFGFLETGHFNLTVFDFQLAAPKKHHRHKKRNNKNKKPRNGQGHSRSLAAKADDDKCDSSKQLCLSDVLENIKGVGFLLKQFEDEASFNRYMDFIRDDPSRCIFQKYLDRKEDEILEEFDADDFTYYPGVQDVDDGYYTHFDDFSPGTFVDDEYADDDYPGRYNDGLHKKQRKTRQQQIQQQKQKHQPRRLENELSSEGRGEVIDVVEDGIYLDMLPRSNWRPNTPWVAYDFEAGQAGFYFLMYQVCHDIEEGAPEGAQDDHVYDIHSRFELDFHFSNRDMFNRVSYLSRGEMVSFFGVVRNDGTTTSGKQLVCLLLHYYSSRWLWNIPGLHLISLYLCFFCPAFMEWQMFRSVFCWCCCCRFLFFAA